MRNIKAVTFDLDGTLLQTPDFDGAIWHASQRVAAAEPRINATELFDANTAIFESAWPEVENQFYLGALEGADISRTVWSRSLERLRHEDPELLNLACEAFLSYAEGTYRLFDDATVLNEMAARYPVGLITNGSPQTQRRKIELTRIADIFDSVVISGEVGVAKPDRRIFTLAATLLDVEPGAILHVGDNPSADVAGALNAGMIAVWLNRNGVTRDAAQPEPHHEIASLSELPGLLA